MQRRIEALQRMRDWAKRSPVYENLAHEMLFEILTLSL
jgi:hypothetical protein